MAFDGNVPLEHCHLLSSRRDEKKAAVSPKETLPPSVICGPELVL
ncbi:hypothetical protein CVCC1112_2474 [Paenarthrobacter nicotinovorans]|nr:hypothetical protein ANMWB30_36660 [Arthrobacter sp. MWB30]GAT87815.1 hypothetical protein CVCC1112_2474 [Paenarthrobacter nicotinovorans]